MRSDRFPKFLCLLAIAFLGWGTYALAGKITVENRTRNDILMAFKFYDHEKKEWVVWGWYRVPSGGKKSWNFKLAPDRKVYWYGKTDDNKRRWPGQGDHGQSVISKKMSGIKASVLKTYADSKVVQFKTREADAEGNLSIRLVD